MGKLRLKFNTFQFVQAANKEMKMYTGIGMTTFWNLLEGVAKRGIELNDEKLNELLFSLGLIDEVKNEKKR